MSAMRSQENTCSSSLSSSSTMPGAPKSDASSLPPITTSSLPSDRQRLIANQSWDKISARHPIGCKNSTPDTETLIDYAATILEMRLADVVRHRRDVKNSRSQASSMVSEDGLINGVKIAPTAVAGEMYEVDIDKGKLEDLEGLQPPSIVLLSSNCRAQVRAYVRRIASMYHDNRYHALEHAVHVTMSANKLLEMLHEGGPVDPDDDTKDMKKFAVSLGASYQSDDSSVSSTESTSGKATTAAAPRPISVSNDKPRQIQPVSSYDNAQRPPPPSLNVSLNDFDRIPRPKKPKRTSSTYLIYSDTFTKFSFVFAAIIHDVDHQGVPNARLVVENDPIVQLYDGISVAEKHSIKVAFRTLNESEFDEFRSLVFESPDDRLHMHHIVTNLVVNTDIASPERAQSTKVRWEEAFSKGAPPPGPLPFGRLSLAGHSPSSEIATVTASEPRLVSMETKVPSYKDPAPIASMCKETRRNSLKRVLQLNGGQTVEYFTATNHEDSRMALRHSVVIETMLNVADVAHSMQSWELFLFWNRNLFEELYDAYKGGRSENNPANGWYENQLFFYKIYVLPLAAKMQMCGVFGRRGGEFLRNAILIRDQWEREGDQITKDMIVSVERESLSSA
jgi:hypothetical protein